MTKREFTQIDEVECSTRCCPCGSTFTWSGINEELAAWMAQHAAHVDPPEPGPIK